MVTPHIKLNTIGFDPISRQNSNFYNETPSTIKSKTTYMKGPYSKNTYTASNLATRPESSTFSVDFASKISEMIPTFPEDTNDEFIFEENKCMAFF